MRGPSPLLLTAAAFLAAPALAQVFASEPEAPLGEIVITAQKRAESLFDAGVAVAVLDGTALNDQRVFQLTDLQGRVPNLDVKEQVPGTIPVLTIRGVGLNDFGAANNPSAGVYVDEIYVASLAMLSFDFFDLERIEVLKGPQGTLYGRNSTAGALNVLSKRPERTFDARAAGSYANFDTFDVEAMINVPLGQTAALRFSGKTIQQGEGYWRSRRLADGGAGDRDFGERDVVSGRLQLAFEPGDAFEANLKIEALRGRSELGQPEFFGAIDPLTGAPCAPVLAGRIDNTQCTDLLGYTDTDGDPYRGDWIRDPVHDTDSLVTTLAMSVDVGGATLTSLTGYVDFDRTFDIDSDATPFRQVDFHEVDEVEQFSQELRLAGTTGRASWLVGAFYSQDDVLTSIPGEHDDLFVTRTLVDVSQDTESMAAFANAEWQLADAVHLVTGVRYTSEDRRYVGGTTDLNPFGFSCLLSPTCTPGFVGPFRLTGIDTTIEDENVSWRLALEYEPSDTALLYGSVSTGVKSGGFFSGISTTDLQLAPFDPEELTAYEVGYRDSRGSLFLDASVFYYDYADIQTFIAVDIGPFTIQRLGNVSEARVYGADFAAVWRPVPGLTLSGGFGWLDTELGAFATLTGDVPEGNGLPNAPDLTANALVRYEHRLTPKLGGAIQVDSAYGDAVFKDALNDPLIAADSYTIVNARLALFANDAHNWEVALWSKNLTDELYVVQGLNTGLGGGNRNFNAPRTYGVTFTYQWQ